MGNRLTFGSRDFPLQVDGDAIFATNSTIYTTEDNTNTDPLAVPNLRTRFRFIGDSETIFNSIGGFKFTYIDPSTTPKVVIDIHGNIDAKSFITIGGTSNDFVKGDGSLDSSIYITEATFNTYTGSTVDTNDIDYVSNVTLNGSSLDFTGVGSGFNSSVDLSPLLDDTNNYVDSIGFSTTTGILTLSRLGLGDLTVDLDGRYLTAHPNIIAASSSNNSNRTYIQDILLDTYGHITGLTTATETVVNTDTNTTYSISAVDGTNTANIRLTAGGSGSGTDDITLSAGSNVTINAVGDTITISSTDTNTNTTYTAGGGLNLIGTVFSHANTSLISSSNNSNRTYIQNVLLDEYGHVTGWTTATETVVNTNDIDYVSNVTLNGSSLDFTGVGSGFNSSVDLSSLLDDTNNYVNSIGFSTATGVLTLGRLGLVDLPVDLDGRYLLVDTFNTYTGNTPFIYAENLDIDSTATETIATADITTFNAIFFDYLVKKGSNLRAGTVMAVHDGTSVEFTDTSTQDLGNTNAVILFVDILGNDLRLRATTLSNDWIIKTRFHTI